MSRNRRSRATSDPATTSTPLDTRKSTGHRRQDGYAAPRADDRLDAQVLDEAKARGFRLAARCSACGHWLVATESVALHLGPVCRSKAASR
ncbi:DUF6011 domain-containing protein [Mycolicibacterium porcinum]|uniref:DUF6011 domain-containing protein n=1 Tax=Mycolicibacterium porcinum TaxID=39693 RepID=UPI001C96B971|nr:DUF6011 domain-containing protein [Mycolicibacterium porcinum]